MEEIKGRESSLTERMFESFTDVRMHEGLFSGLFGSYCS